MLRPAGKILPTGRSGCGSAAEQLVREVAADSVQADPLLRHGVALTHGDGVVLEGVEVDGDAEGRTDLVLAAVATPDGASVVELDVPVLAELSSQGLRLGREVSVAAEWEHRHLDRGQARVELEHDP